MKNAIGKLSSFVKRGRGIKKGKIKIPIVMSLLAALAISGSLIYQTANSSVVSATQLSSMGHNANQGNKNNSARPIFATDVEIAKKTILSSDIIKEIKGKPGTPPGQNKNKKVAEENAATGILGEALDEGAKKYAVVVGVCDYPGTANDLCWSDGDSLNMYQTLIDSGYAAENIYMYRDMDPSNDPDNLTTDGPATFSNIYDAVANIKSAVNKNYNEAEAEDEVVFFFSGHGASGVADDGDNEREDESIIVHDGTDIVFIWDGQLRDWFSDFKTSRIIFIFDSCLAGGMDDVAKEGRIVVAGTGENKVGYVLSSGGESTGEYGEGVFSHYFVNEGMLDGLADGYNKLEAKDGSVTIEEAFDYAKENIPSYYRKQTPIIDDRFSDDLLLGHYLSN